jgi:hypothetical protein
MGIARREARGAAKGVRRAVRDIFPEWNYPKSLKKLGV